jgi:diadenosine tetraphosphate (Ap4A) HIT family hydrolase
MKDKLSDCPFCNPDSDREVIIETTDVYSVYDRFPVTTGHALIIPKRHCADYFELTEEEQTFCWNMVSELKNILTKKYHPDGYNIGINVNEAAGQTIPHVHIHLIPRYFGDVEEPEGGVRGVIPERRMYKSTIGKKTIGRKKQIGILLNEINKERIEQIKNEIQQKESWAINIAENQSKLDKTHIEMVQDFIRDNKTPIRPETLNKLMIQFISSAFSYNRIRKQLRKINREKYHLDNYPIREDHKRILAYLLNEDRFLNEDYWHPQKLGQLIREIDNRGQYKNLHIMSDYWLEHIMGILRTAPAKLIEFTNQNINEFYIRVDGMSKRNFGHNIVKKAQELWEFATELSIGIRNVGTNLMCDFLKECGFTDYAKMDVHMIKNMSEVLNVHNYSKLTDFESFIVTQWLADKINMTPFRMDKIIYVYGVYH